MSCLWHVFSKRESLLSYISKICLKKEAMQFLHRGRLLHEEEVFDVKYKREKLSIRETLVLKFHCAMTCCVAINAKEGDCWIQLSNCLLSLMSHKWHISCQLVLTELTWLARWFSLSTEHF